MRREREYKMEKRGVAGFILWNRSGSRLFPRTQADTRTTLKERLYRVIPRWRTTCHHVSPFITRENTPEGFDKIGAAGLDTVGKSDEEVHTEKNARCSMEIIRGSVFF